MLGSLVISRPVIHEMLKTLLAEISLITCNWCAYSSCLSKPVVVILAAKNVLCAI